MSVKQVSPAKAKVGKKSMSSSGGKKAVDSVSVKENLNLSHGEKKNLTVAGWIQDVSLEVPGLIQVDEYSVGQRELEFSVGMRQQEFGSVVRSELRARALVHAGGNVLALVEASYVCDLGKNEVFESLPHDLYEQLKPKMELLLEMSGHTPPLPETLKQVEA
ncbi:MAG: hypothetical protein DI585_02335 [Pseudomonas fluorescens]|nr:MAG: hypothetical protein DI585_02335 [Pseudomonas fluorescens]